MQICHAITRMSGPNILLKPISSLSEFLAYKRKELGLFEGGVHGGKEGGSLRWKHPKAKISLREEDQQNGGEEDWMRRRASIQI